MYRIRILNPHPERFRDLETSTSAGLQSLPQNQHVTLHGWQDLNPQPTVLETVALPIELHP
jgi:hypothetical protein